MENVLQLYLDGARTTRRFPISVRLVASPPGQGAARRKLQRQYSYCLAPHTHPTHVATARYGTARHGAPRPVSCTPRARPNSCNSPGKRRPEGEGHGPHSSLLLLSRRVIKIKQLRCPVRRALGSAFVVRQASAARPTHRPGPLRRPAF